MTWYSWVELGWVLVMTKQISSVATIQIGFQSRGGLQPTPKGDWFLIQMSDAKPGGKYTSDGLARLPGSEGSDLYRIEPGVVLFQARGSSNRAHVIHELPGPTMASNHFYILRPRADTIVPEYLAWVINSTPVQAKLAALGQGATAKLVAKSAFESIEIPVPPLDTQATIAHVAALQRREAELTESLQALRERLVEQVCLTSTGAAG